MVRHLGKHINLNDKSYIIFTDKTISIKFDFILKNLIKELIWTIEISINGINMPNKNGSFINDTVNIYDFIINTIFYIDGLKRDGIQNSNLDNFNSITTKINRYKYNTRASNNNLYNVYSFSLNPEKFQPSGTINMNKNKTYGIELVIDRVKFINYISNSNNNNINLSDIKFTINLNTFEYNILRFQSGLAGLLFI
jgi:hypothetical protein